MSLRLEAQRKHRKQRFFFKMLRPKITRRCEEKVLQILPGFLCQGPFFTLKTFQGIRELGKSQSLDSLLFVVVWFFLLVPFSFVFCVLYFEVNNPNRKTTDSSMSSIAT